MPLGPRKRSPDMRSRQGKIVNPKNVHKGVVGDRMGPEYSQANCKQYKQTGPKYKGPNYKQKDPNVEKFGSK